MTSLKDMISLDKPPDSTGMLHSFPGPTNLLHTLLGSNGGCATPLVEPALGSVLLEDVGILNVNSFEHDVLLPGLDPASVTAVHGDELPHLEHSEEWIAPAYSILSTWNLSNDPSRFLLQTDVEDRCAASPGVCKSHGGPTQVASSLETLKAPQATLASADTQAMRPSCSVKHAFKPSDSSEFSDAMEDGDSDMHGLDTRNSPSKNLVSERRRRKKLNERLYSLRALVPKISKMDKASIVSDAISYVQDLQKQVEDIEADIHALESGKASSRQMPCHESDDTTTVRRALFTRQYLEHRILELEVSQMEEQTYNLRIHCKKGPGVLVQLTSALEALDLEIVNANLTSVNDHVLNTVVVKVGSGESMTPEELKRLTLDVIPKFGLVF